MNSSTGDRNDAPHATRIVAVHHGETDWNAQMRMQGQLDTALAIAAVVGLPVATDPALRERSFGAFEGHTYAEIDTRWPADAARWRGHDPAFAPAGGETLIEFNARAVAAMTAIAAGARVRSLLVVTHGGVLDCLYRAASGLGLDAPRSWELGNASINRLLYTGERFTLVGWSDTSHLEGDPLDDASEGDCPTVPRAAA